jgi:hypothetical protein
LVRIIANIVRIRSVDLKGRRNAAPSFNDLGLRLSAAGALSGLGNDDVVIGRSLQARRRHVTLHEPGRESGPNANWTPASEEVIRFAIVK